METFYKIVFLPATILCQVIMTIFNWVVWNEPFRTWQLRVIKREGPNCRPFIDANVFLQGRLRDEIYKNRNLQEVLEKERRKRK